jgi:aspartate carbamoyltransferase regulatory subunit
MGKKDIIKIDADFGVDTDVLGYVDPGVTVNVIKNGEIVEKKKIELPEILNGVIRCKNPRCITSTEHSLPQRFRLTDPSGPVYRCVWCEARAKTDFDNK